MNKQSISLITVIALSGCVPVQQSAAPPPALTATATCVYPVITAMPETRELQAKGGINISLAPNAFECVPAVDTVTKEMQPTFAASLALSAVPIRR